jgi:uncharacterized protein
MNKTTYKKIEDYMLSCMRDSAHDEKHVYRVLYFALDIAENYQVNIDALVAAALLHDIGRNAQYKDPKKDHAIVGSEMAYKFLKGIDWCEKDACHVKECIKTHRYRKNTEPESIEAKILFDADKLDVTGAIGIARTFFYEGVMDEPLYTLDHDGNVNDGVNDKEPSFLHEYNFKLKNIYNKFYTARAKEISAGREQTARNFYEAVVREIKEVHATGKKKLETLING